MPFFAHIGLGLSAKRIVPHVPWLPLVLASLGPDLVSLILSPFPGIPTWVSHGMFMNIIWALLAFILTYGFMKRKIGMDESNRKKTLLTASVIGGLVFIHWIFDLFGWPLLLGGLTSNMDGLPYSETGGVPLFFDDSVHFSFGLYRTLPIALIFEFGFLIFGIFMYNSTIKNQKNE